MSSYPIEYNKIFFEKELGDEPKGLGYALKGIAVSYTHLTLPTKA